MTQFNLEEIGFPAALNRAIFEPFLERQRFYLSPFYQRNSAFPALNIWQDENNFYVEAEIPGLRMEQIELTVSGNELSLRAEPRRQSEGEGLTYHRCERGTAGFARLIQLPALVKSESVEAELKNGVLSICLPKADEAKARKITVKSS